MSWNPQVNKTVFVGEASGVDARGRKLPETITVSADERTITHTSGGARLVTVFSDKAGQEALDRIRASVHQSSSQASDVSAPKRSFNWADTTPPSATQGYATSYFSVVASKSGSSVNWGASSMLPSQGLISTSVPEVRRSYPLGLTESYCSAVTITDHIASDASTFPPNVEQYKSLLNWIQERLATTWGKMPASTVYCRTERHCRLLIVGPTASALICKIDSTEYRSEYQTTVVAYPLKEVSEEQQHQIKSSLQEACSQLGYRLHYIPNFCNPTMPFGLVQSYGGVLPPG